MLTIIAFLLLFIPTVFQYKIGVKCLNKKINIKFYLVCIISFVLQFLMTILSFALIVYSITSSGGKCATGAVGIFFFSFLIAIILLFVILLQITNRKKIDS